MKRIYIAATALFLFAVPAVAQNTFAMGMGMEKCARITSDSLKIRAASDWAMGYWTGLNNALGLGVGSSTDPDHLAPEIIKRCVQAPDELLMIATQFVWKKYRVAGS